MDLSGSYLASVQVVTETDRFKEDWQFSSLIAGPASNSNSSFLLHIWAKGDAYGISAETLAAYNSTALGGFACLASCLPMLAASFIVDGNGMVSTAG